MICASTELYQFIDFGMQPNGNRFLFPEEAATEPRLPVAMLVCEDCGLVQMAEPVTGEFLFAEHPYLTGVNKPYVEHFQNLVPRIIQKIDLTSNALVVDIGCNDGTLLSLFEKAGMRTLGIDPGRLSGKVARGNGITVAETFWTAATAESFKALEFRPDLITATASFYHMQDINDYVAGLSRVMGPNTVFFAQCVYLKTVLENAQIDQFYHEHSCVHAVRPLKRLFARHGLRILDVEYSDVQGGSILIYVGREEHPMQTQLSVTQAIDKEIQLGMNQRDIYDQLRVRFQSNAKNLVDLLRRIKSEGKTIHAIGASLRGMSLVNYFGITRELIDSVLEVNELKIGRIAPGSHIPVVDERTIKSQPDVYLMLSWTFADFLIQKYDKFLRGGGEIIIPVPNVRVITRNDISTPAKQ